VRFGFVVSRAYKLYVFWEKNVGAPAFASKAFAGGHFAITDASGPELFLPVRGDTNREFTGLGCRYFKLK
jgi:hypothetical protein